MTDREKAYSVISRTGGTRHIADVMNDAETEDLADIHDRATEGTLGQLVKEFWGRRAERLAELKAADDVQIDDAQLDG